MRSRATGPISAIIADDERLARDELKYLLEQIGDIEVVATAGNGIEALEAIEKLDPAIAFLDIQMPGLDGLSVLRRLRESQIEPPHIIFSTAYDQFAVEAFRLEAMDYLLKPVERERLEETIERARRALGDRFSEPSPIPQRVGPAFSKLLLKSGAQEPDYRSAGSGLRHHRRRRYYAGDRRRRRAIELSHSGRTAGRARPRGILACPPQLCREYQSDTGGDAVVQVHVSAPDG